MPAPVPLSSHRARGLTLSLAALTAAAFFAARALEHHGEEQNAELLRRAEALGAVVSAAAQCDEEAASVAKVPSPRMRRHVFALTPCRTTRRCARA